MNDFIWQLDFLQKNKIKIVPISELQHPEKLDDFCVSLTFDDGNDSDYDIVFQHLKERNIPASFFIPTNETELSWSLISEMHNNGFEFGSHGLNHIDLCTVSANEVMHELNESKKTLDVELSTDTDCLSFPYGSYSKKIITAALTLGYKQLLTTNRKINYPENRSCILHRWNVKHNLKRKQFEKLIMNRNYRVRILKIESLRQFGMKIVGHSISDKINVFLNSKKS